VLVEVVTEPKAPTEILTQLNRGPAFALVGLARCVTSLNAELPALAAGIPRPLRLRLHQTCSQKDQGGQNQTATDHGEVP